VKVVSAGEFDSYLRELASNPEAQVTGDVRGAIPTQPEYGKVPGQSGNSEGEGTEK
jgi:hypothetical protein